VFILELDRRIAFADALRALSEQPGLVGLTGTGASSFVACAPIDASDAIVPPLATPCAGWGGRAAAPRWVGVVPYEALRDLERPAWTRPDARPPVTFASPTWARYDAVLRIDHRSSMSVIEADDERAARRLLDALRGRPRRDDFALRALPGERDGAHVARVRAALAYIAKGDVYQVNVARFLHFQLRGSRVEMFLRTLRQSPVSYGFYGDFRGDIVAAASPELALSVHGRTLRTGPIKGTRARGACATSDLRAAADLDASEKERAELTMAIDLHRNDLGRVAAPGTVDVARGPHLTRGAFVWSRGAEITARRAPGSTLEDCLRAVFPAGSVTGAPKIRAMEIIRELEVERRGLYTGALGYVGRDGAVVLAMAIRTMEISRDGAVRYGTGGGIVEGSLPELELAETGWKAAHLSALLG
jgi:anthranilate/para-aminobenzoate synthase component I